MRTISILTPSPDIEMVTDAPEVEEVTFTLVTNKKSKKKGKTSPPPNSRNKTLLVSRASSVPKTVTTSLASKLAVTCPISAVAATIFSKSAQSQSTPLLVPLASKPKPNAKLFSQASKTNNTTQKTPRFAFASFYKDFLHLLQFKEAFSNLLQVTIISMYQVSLDIIKASQESLSYPTVSRMFKMMTQGSTRC